MIDKFKGKYFFLSNFYPATITYNGLTFLNNEAAFQAQKCKDQKDKEKFCSLSSFDAKKLGRRVSLRRDWEVIKYRVMYEICKEKFRQHDDLKMLLLETHEEELVEGNTWGDMIWGSVDGFGENRLGKILMRIRSELRDGI